MIILTHGAIKYKVAAPNVCSIAFKVLVEYCLCYLTKGKILFFLGCLVSQRNKGSL